MKKQTKAKQLTCRSGIWTGLSKGVPQVSAQILQKYLTAVPSTLWTLNLLPVKSIGTHAECFFLI